MKCLICDVQINIAFSKRVGDIGIGTANAVSLLQLYRDFLRLEANEDDRVCINCSNKLLDFHIFKEKAVETYMKRLEDSVVVDEDLGSMPELDDITPPEINSDNKSELPHSNVVDPAYKDPIKIKPSAIKKEMLSGMPFKRNENNEFACPECPVIFLRKQALEDHYIWLHSNRSSFSCKLCTIEFTNYIDLKKHINSSHIDKPFICDFCGRKYRTHSNLQSHVQQKHIEKPIIETKCPKAFEDDDSVEDQPPTYPCDICQKFLSSKMSLRRHKATAHAIGGINKPYKCDVCYTFWPSKAGLADHYTKHTNEKNYSCHVCAKTFRTKSALAVHLQNVHSTSKDHCCYMCGQMFKTQAILKAHYLSHNSEKAFICSTCGASFKQPASLTIHKQKHKDQDAGVVLKCDICSKIFTNRRTFKNHQLLHDGPDLQCSYCHRIYKAKESLLKHIRSTHQKLITRIKCTVCGKTLWNRKIMREHVNKEHKAVLKITGKKADEFLQKIEKTKTDRSQKEKKKQQEPTAADMITVHVLTI